MLRFALAVVALACSCLTSEIAVADTVVPSVLGLTAEKAKAVLDEAGLQIKLDEATGVLSIHPVKTVGYQEPAGGASVADGATISVRLSSGIWIRSFEGEPIEVARRMLGAVGIKFEVIETKAPGVPKGVVIGQIPSALDLIDASMTVPKIQVSVGPWIVVPNLVGLTMSQVTSTLSPMDLAVEVLSGPKQDGSFPIGPVSGKADACVSTDFVARVVTMDPAAGVLVFPQHTIHVTTKREDTHVIDVPCHCDGLKCIEK